LETHGDFIVEDTEDYAVDYYKYKVDDSGDTPVVVPRLLGSIELSCDKEQLDDGRYSMPAGDTATITSDSSVTGTPEDLTLPR